MNFINKRLADNSLTTYSQAIQNLNDYLKDHKLKFSFKNIKKWLSTIKNANTYNIYYSAVKSFLLNKYKRKTVEENTKLRIFFDGIRWAKPLRTLSNIAYLTEDQVNHLADSSTTKIKYFTLALFQTGCRISELINIEINDCKTKGKYTYIKITGKNDFEREVMMKADLYKNIRSEFKGKKYLFETINEAQYSRVYVSKKISQVAKKLDYEGIAAHSLRHSKAMYLKDKGLTPDEIARALGHRDVLTTLTYYFHNSPGADVQLGDL